MSLFLAKKVENYLMQSLSPFADLIKKINDRKKIAQQIFACLPKELASSCEIGSCTSHELVLIMSNGMLATQLYFHIPEILKRFQNHPHLNYISRIQCKVMPFSQAPIFEDNQNVVHKLSLSRVTANCLKETAATIQDKELRAVMMKIASHVKYQD